jgi:hypothetical protein
MTETLYHGSHRGTFVAHEGLCLTDDQDVAETYAANGSTFAVTIGLDALTVEECAGYDHDENDAPADGFAFRAAAAARGVDVLVYDDEDEQGRAHACYRVISARALEMLTATEIDTDDEW